jgi:hypothetical protein
MTKVKTKNIHTAEEVKQLKAEFIAQFFGVYKGVLFLRPTSFKFIEIRYRNLKHIHPGDIPQIIAQELIKSMGRAEIVYKRETRKRFPWGEVLENIDHPERMTLIKKTMTNAGKKVKEIGEDSKKIHGKQHFLPIISKDISDFSDFIESKSIEIKERDPLVAEVMKELTPAQIETFETILEAGGWGESGYNEYIAEIMGVKKNMVANNRTRIKQSIQEMDLDKLNKSKQVKDLKKKAEKLENALGMEENDLQAFIVNEFKQDSPLSQRIDLTVDVVTVKEICEHLKNGTPISRASLYQIATIIIKELNQIEAKLDGLKPC